MPNAEIPNDQRILNLETQMASRQAKPGKGGRRVMEYVTKAFQWKPTGNQSAQESPTNTWKRVLRCGRATCRVKRRQRVGRPCY